MQCLHCIIHYCFYDYLKWRKMLNRPPPHINRKCRCGNGIVSISFNWYLKLSYFMLRLMVNYDECLLQISSLFLVFILLFFLQAYIFVFALVPEKSIMATIFSFSQIATVFCLLFYMCSQDKEECVFRLSGKVRQLLRPLYVTIVEFG